MTQQKEQAFRSVWKAYEKALVYNTQVGLYDTVKTNENFFIGKQWEGVEANGLPTPVFNFLKRVVLFTVAGITSSRLKMQATGLPGPEEEQSEVVADVVNNEFEKLFEINKIGALVREYLRNTAVDGDGCLYTYWDPDAETGQAFKGAIVTEVIENTRVHFGNTTDRRVQKQPFIILSSRERTEDVRERAENNGACDWAAIKSDTDERGSSKIYSTDDDMTTVLLKLWRNKETETVWAYECTRDSDVRPAWDTGLTLYPVTWLCWDYIPDSYHGQAMITGLIPNQIFINKLYAMSMISLMTTAYPKIVYDKTRVLKWDNRVGAAIPVQGGDVNGVAKIIDPAQISPQIAQFIQMAVSDTQSNLGATNVALGDVRPENTSAIIALQKAAAVPNEMTRQNLYQSLEDLGRIYIDFMGEYYGTRGVPHRRNDKSAGSESLDDDMPVDFDLTRLRQTNLSLKLDVGASSYWSEIAAMQTLDNLMMRGKLDLVDYLERVPDGYIVKKQELVDKLKGLRDKAEEEKKMASAVLPAGTSAGAAQPAIMPGRLPASNKTLGALSVTARNAPSAAPTAQMQQAKLVHDALNAAGGTGNPEALPKTAVSGLGPRRQLPAKLAE